MISLDKKVESSFSPLPSLKESEDKQISSFSDLLKGFHFHEEKENTLLTKEIPPKEEIPKTVDKLLSLLQNSSDSQNQAVVLIAPKELKVLISNAKQSLKNQILHSDAYKKSEIKELPKTLKGLVEVAKKFDLQISKISIESISSSEPKVKSSEIPKLNTLNRTLGIEVESKKQELKPLAAILKMTKETPPNREIKVISEVKIERTETKKEPSSKNISELLKESSSTTKTESKLEKAPLVNEYKTDTQPKEILSKNSLKKPTQTPLDLKQTKQEELPKDEKYNQVKIATALKNSMPKVQELDVKSNVGATQQISTVHRVEKNPKVKADETLKLLLRGDKKRETSLGLTADFSVSTAKVIAPTASTDALKSLASLLHGNSDKKESSVEFKTESVTINKADNFEVKLNEAKQMLKYLSSDVKTAIEDYKSPFTRIKVQLNPQKLGEVDLTIVQRGKNLHVNISSNNAAINTLAMNANELKVQLNNSGINNATLNFNNSAQSESNSQQQQRHNEQQARDEYVYFKDEESNEELVSSLEIVVPSYA